MERIEIGKLLDSPSLYIDTNLPGAVVIEQLPRVMVTGARAGAASQTSVVDSLRTIAAADFLPALDSKQKRAYAEYLNRGPLSSGGPKVLSNRQLVDLVRANPGGASIAQQAWNSPEVQGTRGPFSTVARALVGVVGDALGGYDGYNPVSNQYYGAEQREDATRRMALNAFSIALGPATSQAAVELSALRGGGAGRTLSPYSGDVYSPDFVGPVKWNYYYRGDATARTDFLSSMAQERGAAATTEFLNSRATEPLSSIYAQHGIGSQALPTIGVSDNPLVAEYFARGPLQTQNGFVTTFRIEAREAERLTIPNWDNPMSFMELNPSIGLSEREFLFHVQIDPRYVVKQVPVGPR